MTNYLQTKRNIYQFNALTRRKNIFFKTNCKSMSGCKIIFNYLLLYLLQDESTEY